jgi:heme-degrading monooxygenase HmoA
MVGVFVTFKYEDGFDPSAITTIAEGARSKFEGMPGLRSKAFTLDEERHVATNFYVWESVEAAQAFFTEEMLQGVTKLYGVRPSIEYVEIAALVDNAH